MLLIVTFRLPGAAVGGFFSLLISREAPITTLRGGIGIVASFLCGTAFLLIGAILLVDYPLTHFLWVILSFFVAFYGLSAMSNYGARDSLRNRHRPLRSSLGSSGPSSRSSSSPTFGFSAVWRLPSP